MFRKKLFAKVAALLCGTAAFVIFFGDRAAFPPAGYKAASVDDVLSFPSQSLVAHGFWKGENVFEEISSPSECLALLDELEKREDEPLPPGKTNHLECNSLETDLKIMAFKSRKTDGIYLYVDRSSLAGRSAPARVGRNILGGGVAP